jgi:hypothetical protein
MRPRRTAKLLERLGLSCLLCAALAPAAARAGGAGDPGAPWLTDIDLTRATGMAGAMTAFASGNDAMTVNPAGLAQNHSYHFQIDGMDDVKFPAEGVIVSVADSTTGTGVGSGLIFERWGAGQLGSRGEGWLGGLSYAYKTGAFMFGGTTHLLHFAGPDGSTIHTFTEDIGLMANTGSFQLGATLKNFTFDFSNQPLFPLTGTFGIAFGSDSNFHLSSDYKIDFSDSSNLKHQLSFGGEMLFLKTLALRTGYRWDVTEHLGWLTLGASVLTQSFAVGAAWRRRVDGPNMEQALEASVTLFLE